jgi:hypothetical protein
LSGSTTKKVVLERFDREPLRGFVNPRLWQQAEGVEVLAPDGVVGLVAYDQIKAVCFVRDLEGPGIFSERREFRARPKTTGLWVLCVFRDGDRLEGLILNNLLAIDAAGITLTPPDVSGNTQKVFLPKSALTSAEVVGVIGGRKRQRPSAEEEAQITLF